MYFIDFAKNIIKKNNLGVLIWLVLNTAIVTAVLGSCFGGDLANYAKGAVIYVGVLAVSLSPLGEWMLRVQNGCEKITRKDYLDRLTPLFNEVYARAKAKNPELADNIRLYMIDSDDANAFATGRKTVCITRGLLRYPDQQIKAVLAHEFGHLVHKDTDAILIISVGNLLVTAMFVIFRIAFRIFSFLFSLLFGYISESFVMGFMAGVTRAVMDVFLCGAMYLWAKFGALLCLHSSRKNENQADRYSYELGYGQSLCAFLDRLPPSRDTGLWATLNASHPTVTHGLDIFSNWAVLTRNAGDERIHTPEWTEAEKLCRINDERTCIEPKISNVPVYFSSNYYIGFLKGVLKMLKNIRKLSALALAFLLAVFLISMNTTAYASVSNASKFLDVPAESWYATPVEWAISRSITNGTSSSTFSPNEPCSNAQVVTFIWRACGSIDPQIENPFEDISESDYFYKPALWAYENNMVTGTSFCPDKPCTRSMAITYLWKEAGQPQSSTNTNFVDVNRDHTKAVAWAVDMRITNGTSKSTFSPELVCTRAQIITFLFRDLTGGHIGS